MGKQCDLLTAKMQLKLKYFIKVKNEFTHFCNIDQYANFKCKITINWQQKETNVKNGLLILINLVLFTFRRPC